MSLILNAAYNCYRTLGFRPDDNCLQSLVLGSGKKYDLFSTVNYTELYLYEELIFSINLAREAEGLNNYMHHVIRLTKEQFSSKDDVSPQDVQGMMITLGYEVADVLFEQANIIPVHDNSWFVDYLNSRLRHYEPLFIDSYNCSEPIPENSFRFGIKQNDHPLLKYMGAISDSFADALNIDRAYPMLQELVYLRRQSVLESSIAIAIV